jgi:hypothetical protein
MTKFAQFWLVLTSLAPIGCVQAAVDFDRGHSERGRVLAILVVLLVAIALGLLYGVARYGHPVPKEVKEAAIKESEPLAFFVSYALPLVAAKEGAASAWGIAVFSIILGVVLWQLRAFHVNPLVAIFGYKFFSAKTDGGATVLILTRGRLLPGGTLRVIRVSDYLWLLPSQEQGGHDGKVGLASRADARPDGA